MVLVTAEALARWLAVFRIFPAAQQEYRFAPPRRWRFDLAWPDRKLAVEIEGGTWSYGRHVRAVGYEADCEKYNEATLLGWRVLRFTTAMVEDGRAIATLQECEKQVKELSATAR